MLISSSYNEIINTKKAIEDLCVTEPTIYTKFIRLVKLTRQFQYGYQYMGTLMMDEDSSHFKPSLQDDYVLAVYHQEIEKIKEDIKFFDLKQLLKTYKQVSYTNISKLALGENPSTLVGPNVVR